MTDWTSRVVVITGAAGGIGSAMSRWYAGAGARVALIDRDADTLAELARDLRTDDAQVGEHVADIGDEGAVDDVIDAVNATRGGVDVLVNNAGFADDDDLLGTTPERWDAQIDTCLRGAYVCARAVIPGMRQRARGVVLNISSVNAALYVGNEAYSAAKAGLDSLTRSIAVRYGPDGIRAVGIGAGTIVTPAWDARVARDPSVVNRLARWYPAGRLGRPDDVVSLAAFLTSDQASWLTGTTVMLDGGLTAGNPVMTAEILGDDQP